jgi:hypothetical protein
MVRGPTKVEEKSKNFFFEKKKQKTFTNCVQRASQMGQSGAARNRQKFFASFFQKRSACLSCDGAIVID